MLAGIGDQVSALREHQQSCKHIRAAYCAVWPGDTDVLVSVGYYRSED